MLAVFVEVQSVLHCHGVAFLSLPHDQLPAPGVRVLQCIARQIFHPTSHKYGAGIVACLQTIGVGSHTGCVGQRNIVDAGVRLAILPNHSEITSDVDAADFVQSVAIFEEDFLSFFISQVSVLNPS